MTRAEHLQWCKGRAHREYAFYQEKDPANAVRNAVTSMASDLDKHPETEKLAPMAAMLGIGVMRGQIDLNKFIDGFN